MNPFPNIENCPGTLAAGYNSYSPAALQQMFESREISPLLDFSDDANSRIRIPEDAGRISISGVQKKLPAIVNNGKICLAPEGIQSRYIIKPAPDDKRLKYRDQLPANEHLTMQIAFQVYGLTTAKNALVFFQNGEPAYITKRFDVKDDCTRRMQEDFASLAQKTNEIHGKSFKYTGNYADIGLLFQKHTAAWPIDASKFFRLTVFNYLFGNGDAHLKNFSLLQSENGDYSLSPAYNLINTSLHIRQKKDFALEEGLFRKELHSKIYRRKGHPCQDDFADFGKILGLSAIQIKSILDGFLTRHFMIYELTARSFLNEKLKRMYIRSYEERLKQLRRSSVFRII